MAKIIVNGKTVQPCKTVKLYRKVGAKELDRLLRENKKDMGYEPVKKKLPE